MRILFVADGQSPHARNWIHNLVRDGHEIHLVSTYPCETDSLAVSSSAVITVDFSAKARADEKAATMGTAASNQKTAFIGRLRGSILWKMLAKVRNASAPLSAVRRAPELSKVIDRVKPDLVHAMRIPFEGILASQALLNSPVPLVISTWGNDFTLFAAQSPAIARLTRKALERADAIHSDCAQDLRIARETYGFSQEKLGIVLPGNGGVRTDIFYIGTENETVAEQYGLDPQKPIILNPRGIKPYIRNDVFFSAIPKILAVFPDAQFCAISMQGKSLAENAVDEHSIRNNVRLLPSVPHDAMAGLFRLADIVVSPSDHDGTPNTLLEAMACGAFPVVGDIESVREWVVDGVNGIAVDHTSADALASGVIRALQDNALRMSARLANVSIISERAALTAVFPQVSGFYSEVAGSLQRG